MRGVGLLSLVLLAAAGAVPAVAAPAASSSEAAKVAARAKVQEGAALFEHGDFQGALARFDEAFERFPNAVIQFNRAQALRGLGRNVDAAEALERFLAEAKNVSRERRVEAEQDLTELRRTLGAIRIVCEIDGAAVLVDGRRIGETPFSEPVRVAAGTREISARKAGLTTFNKSIDVPAQGERKVEIVLTAPVATVELSRMPATRAPSAGGEPTSAGSEPVVVARPAPDEGQLSHARQIGLYLRGDAKVTGPMGWVTVVGLSYGIGSRFEIGLAALIGFYKGGAAEARLFLADGALKPVVRLGVPAFSNGGLKVGVQPAAGLVLDVGAHVGFAAELSAVYFPSAPAGDPKLLFIPTIGTQIRF